MADKILGALLAGGQSRRFGSDKAFAVWRDRTLIDHSYATLKTVTNDIVICGREARTAQGIVDRPAAGYGPLGGLNAALHWGAQHGYDRVITIGCDTPLVPKTLLALITGVNCAVFAIECPIIGGWPTNLAAKLDHFLDVDPKCSMKGWADFAGAQGVASAFIANVNAPADLAALDRTTH